MKNGVLSDSFQCKPEMAFLSDFLKLKLRIKMYFMSEKNMNISKNGCISWNRTP